MHISKKTWFFIIPAAVIYIGSVSFFIAAALKQKASVPVPAVSEDLTAEQTDENAEVQIAEAAEAMDEISADAEYELPDLVPGQGGLDLSPAEISKEDVPELYYTVYRLKPGDMIGTLAEDYGITQDTLISVNGIKNSRTIQIGQYIRIPSIPGIVYTTKKSGETAQTIAEKYNVSADKIAFVNNKGLEEELKEGLTLFVPDAELDWVTRQEINGDLFKRPLRKGYYFSSYDGWRKNPFSGRRTFHNGIDMAIAKGTPVYAALDGRVSSTGWDNVYGNYVKVAHHSGYVTMYAHLSKITTKKGAYVTTSTKIGEVGSTGQSTGPHLHFTVYKNGRTTNPALLWN